MNEFVGTVPFLRIASRMCVCDFPIGILGQVWYLIVSIPDLCTLTYFEMKTMHFHIAQTGLFLGQFGTHEKVSWDAR